MVRQGSRFVALATIALGSFFLDRSPAQCGVTWTSVATPPGPVGSVFAAVHLPNGDIVVGGAFAMAGNHAANNVARWNGSEWLPIGNGLPTVVHSLEVLANGDLVAGGLFTLTGPGGTSHVARWDGVSWQPIGDSATLVRDIAQLPNGDLVVCGPGSASLRHLSRWDGATWTDFGPPIATGEIRRLAVLTNGDLVAGGTFRTSASPVIECLAIWNGTSLDQVGIADDFNSVRAVMALPFGQFVAAGSFQLNGQTTTTAFYDGVGLTDLDAPDGQYESLAFDAQGRLLVGGRTPIFASPAGSQVARFDGSSWTQLPVGGPHTVLAMLPGAVDSLTVAGLTTSDNVHAPSSVRRFDGSSWNNLGGTPDAPEVRAMATLPNGDIVVAGAFASIGGVPARNLARWDGQSFAELGGGTDRPIDSLDVSPSGLVAIGGNFLSVGGSPASGCAIWDGNAWTIPGPTATYPSRIAVNDQAQLLASSGSGLAFFDGSTWSHFASTATTDMVALDNGEFLFCGLSVPPNTSSVKRFDGSSVADEITGLTFGYALLRLRDGSVVTSGTVPQPTLLRRIGGAWTVEVTGPDVPRLMSELAGDVIGSSGSSTYGVRRIHDGVVTQLASLAGVTSAAATVTAIAGNQFGEILVGGTFVKADGVVSAGIVRATANCPAAATTFGAGCFGSAGPVTLRADDLPWLDGTFRSTVKGMAQPSIALHLAGFAPAATPLPLAAPGCTLHVDPVEFQFALTTGSEQQFAYEVPANPALVGAQFRTQVLGIELDALGAITQLTASNALQLTVGSL